MSTKQKLCIVVYDDGEGYQSAYGADSDCDGALQGDEPVFVFANRKAARKAIEISKKFAQLQKLQGKIYNDDFISCIRFVKIVDAKLEGFEVLHA